MSWWITVWQFNVVTLKSIVVSCSQCHDFLWLKLKRSHTVSCPCFSKSKSHWFAKWFQLTLQKSNDSWLELELQLKQRVATSSAFTDDTNQWWLARPSLLIPNIFFPGWRQDGDGRCVPNGRHWALFWRAFGWNETPLEGSRGPTVLRAIKRVPA